MSGHPGAKALFGVAITGGGVDMVHAVGQQQFQGLVCLGLADLAQGGRAEEGASAQVAGAAKYRFGNHRSVSFARPGPVLVQAAQAGGQFGVAGLQLGQFVALFLHDGGGRFLGKGAV